MIVLFKELICLVIFDVDGLNVIIDYCDIFKDCVGLWILIFYFGEF